MGPGSGVEGYWVLRSGSGGGEVLGPQIRGLGWRGPGSLGPKLKMEGSWVLRTGVGGGRVLGP